LAINRTIDTHGYIYKDKFNPLIPSSNKLDTSSQSICISDASFRIKLHQNQTYILVVTTSYANTTGSFMITALGSSNTTATLIGE